MRHRFITRRLSLSALASSVTVVALSAFLFVSSSAQDNTLPSFWDAKADAELALDIANAMTDEELLAQILMFGWAGEDPSPLVVSWVHDRSLGSIKVFGWNTDNTIKVAESIKILQENAAAGRFSVPLFVATDQEGGWIRHIKGSTSQTPGNLAIGASGVPADAWYSGFYISRELAALGINLNFAPTVDLYTNHDSTVIGTRSFGEDPIAAGVLGAAFVAGSRAAGVLTTAKHFPGHGDTGLDSHGHLPVIDISRKTLFERELVPFDILIKSGVTAVMPGHLCFPRVTGTSEPATFSRKFIGEILKKDLAFDGLVITDDIMMNGATEYAGSVSRAVQLAIEAGNDIVESSTTPGFGDALWTSTLAKMSKSPEFRARVADSARRVLEAKLAYFKDDLSVPLFPDVAKIPERVPDREGERFFLSQAVRSVTLARGELMPVRERGKGMVIAGSFPAFLEEGIRRFPDAAASGINGGLLRLARSGDTVIFCLSAKEHVDYLWELSRLGKRVIVVSAQSPVLLTGTPSVEAAIAIYGYSPWSFMAAFGAIAGDFVPTGTLPIKDVR